MPVYLPPPQVEVSAGHLFSTEFLDCYFQKENPLAEVEHVFIQGSELWQSWNKATAKGQRQFLIGETGFGSGLNFILTWQHWRQWCQAHSASQMQLHFTSVECAPLTVLHLQEVYRGFPSLQEFADTLLGCWPAPWRGCHQRQLTDRVTLSLLFGDAVEMLREHSFQVDTWFLDGFAPARNAGMWQQDVYELLARHSKPAARLATFTAAGHVRRGLTLAGFEMSRQPGFQKREMMTGIFTSSQPGSAEPQNFCGKGFKFVASSDPAPPERFAVIGAGYAGLHAAKALINAGAQVDIYDAEQSEMLGASGNHAHLLYLNPRYAVNRFNHFFEQAYSFALSHYEGRPGVTPTGILYLLDEPQFQQWDRLFDASGWSSDWLALKTPAQATALAGVPLKCGGVWMPHGHMIAPYEYAQGILKELDIQVKTNHRLTKLSNLGQGWQLDFTRNEMFQNEKSQSDEKDGSSIFRATYDAVVLAAGAGTSKLLETLGNKCLGQQEDKLSHWRYPIRPIAGQSSMLSQEILRGFGVPELKAAICGAGYITTGLNGAYSIGSQFFPDQVSEGLSQSAHDANIIDLQKSLNLPLSESMLQQAMIGGFAATRIQTTDYLPMTGAIFPESGQHLYIAAGFGAKGSLVTPFAAQLLVQNIFGGAPVMADNLADLINPQRFANRLNK